MTRVVSFLYKYTDFGWLAVIGVLGGLLGAAYTLFFGLTLTREYALDIGTVAMKPYKLSALVSYSHRYTDFGWLAVIGVLGGLLGAAYTTLVVLFTRLRRRFLGKKPRMKVRVHIHGIHIPLLTQTLPGKHHHRAPRLEQRRHALSLYIYIYIHTHIYIYLYLYDCILDIYT